MSGYDAYIKEKILELEQLKSKDNISIILDTHSRRDISKICGISYKTVLEWVKTRKFPLWSIEKLGFRIVK